MRVSQTLYLKYIDASLNSAAYNQSYNCPICENLVHPGAYHHHHIGEEVFHSTDDPELLEEEE